VHVLSKLHKSIQIVFGKVFKIKQGVPSKPWASVANGLWEGLWMCLASSTPIALPYSSTALTSRQPHQSPYLKNNQIMWSPTKKTFPLGLSKHLEKHTKFTSKSLVWMSLNSHVFLVPSRWNNQVSSTPIFGIKTFIPSNSVDVLKAIELNLSFFCRPLLSWSMIIYVYIKYKPWKNHVQT